MKDNSYAYGKCFTCAKKFTPHSKDIYEEVIAIKPYHFMARSNRKELYVLAVMYCDDHIEGVIIRRNLEADQRMMDRFYEGERRREVINQIRDNFYNTTIAKSWGKPVTQGIVDALKSIINKYRKRKSKQLTITVKNPLGDRQSFEGFTEDIIDGINKASKRDIKRDTLPIKDEPKEEEDDHVDDH